MKKLAAIIFASLLLTSPIFALRDYQAITNNPEITCTITTLSKEETKQLTGNPCSTTQTAHTYSSSGQMMYTTVPTHAKQPWEKYMAVKVSVTNNSAQKIAIKKDQYFEFMTLKKAFASKEEIMHMYPWFNFNMIAWGISTGIFSLATVLATMGAEKTGQKVLGGIILGFITLGSLCGIYENYLHSQKYNALIKSTSKEPNDSGFFKIAPGKTFKDLFFINLDYADYDFFESFMPTLLYKSEQETK